MYSINLDRYNVWKARMDSLILKHPHPEEIHSYLSLRSSLGKLESKFKTFVVAAGGYLGLNATAILYPKVLVSPFTSIPFVTLSVMSVYNLSASG